MDEHDMERARNLARTIPVELEVVGSPLLAEMIRPALLAAALPCEACGGDMDYAEERAPERCALGVLLFFRLLCQDCLRTALQADIARGGEAIKRVRDSQPTPN